MTDPITVDGSFRDPSGFLFYSDNTLYRQINMVYKEHYDFFIKSGLYDALISEKKLIPHKEIKSFVGTADSYKIIKPELIPFISYPYEWCFSQLKDAALLTLEIQKIALKHDMILKDCSAYNVQFYKGKPVLIDTLSFEKYTDGQLWKGYQQFCKHFLAPLALMSHKDVRLNQLFRIYIDGIPLDLASKLLPFKTRLNFSLLSNIHLHAKSQKHFETKDIKKIKKRKLNKRSLEGIVSNLQSYIKKSSWTPQETEWSDYYHDTNYTQNSFEQKNHIIESFFDKHPPCTVWDLGSNIGIFSRMSSVKGNYTISFDADVDAVEKNYSLSVEKNDEHILPLILDLSNPSPDIGWAHSERTSLIKRGPVDVVLSLALIHHLAISNNLPLNKIALFFKNICRTLIIEFVPKTDSQVERLLLNREDVFPDYTIIHFENEFQKFFKIKEKINLIDSKRVLYVMETI